LSFAALVAKAMPMKSHGKHNPENGLPETQKPQAHAVFILTLSFRRGTHGIK
jgi:hypothetical protein